MKRIWGVVILLITYGSLYPFNFISSSIPPPVLETFARTWDDRVFQGDMLANIFIFIPFGFIGWMVLSSSAKWRLAQLLIVGGVFGMGLQLLQYFLPSRTPSIVDGIANLGGILLGSLLAALVERHQKNRNLALNPELITPITLLVCWFGLRLMPFIPFFRWKQIEISLRPIYSYPEVNPIEVMAGAIGWLLVFMFLRIIFPAWRFRSCILIILGCFLLESLIIYNYVLMDDVLGALFALILWLFVQERADRYHWLLFGVAAYLLLRGVLPLQYLHQPRDFQWIPFTGFLGGSVYFNIVSFFHKFFFYGAAIWLGLKSGWGWTRILASLVGLTLVLEIIQLWSIQHVPEITDPLLVLLVGFVLYTGSRQTELFRPSNSQA